MELISARYQEAGGWDAGTEAALSEFIMRVAANGVPGGSYLHPEPVIERRLLGREIPRIDRGQS